VTLCPSQAHLVNEDGEKTETQQFKKKSGYSMTVESTGETDGVVKARHPLSRDQQSASMGTPQPHAQDMGGRRPSFLQESGVVQFFRRHRE